MATWTKSSGYFTLQLDVTQQSQSVNDNTSTLAWTLTLKTGSTYFSNVRIGYTIKVEGTQIAYASYSSQPSYTMERNDSLTLATGTATVEHDADGTKTIASGDITAVLNTQTGNIVPNISLASTTALALTTIPRTSSISISGSSTLMGTARTITIDRASSSFTHTLTYTFGSATGTIATKTTSTSVSWTPPKSLASQVASGSIRANGTVTCQTYYGSDLVGTSTASFVAQIPPSTMTKSNPTMGVSTSFTISRAASNLSHKITYTFVSASGTAVSTTSSTSPTWTPPYSLASQLAITSGTKTGTISYVLTTYNGSASVGTKSYTATLSAPSASLSVPSSMTMGTASTLTISEQATAFVHTITGTFEGTSMTVATKTASTSVSCNFAIDTFGPLIPTAKSGTATIKQTVYESSSSSVVVAYNEYTTTLKVPTTKPTASISTAVVTSLSSQFSSVYVQNNAKVKITVDLASATHAYITSATATIDGYTKAFSVSGNYDTFRNLSVTSNNLETSGSRTISVTVTDARGYSGTYTTTINVLAYSNPALVAGSGETKPIIERSDANGNADDDGTYLHINLGNSFSPMGGINTGYVAYKIGTGAETVLSSGTSSPIYVNTVTSDTLALTSTYRVTVRIYDDVGYEVTRMVVIPSQTVTFDLRNGGLGVGIGMFSQGDNRFDIAWNTWNHGNIYKSLSLSYSAGSVSSIRSKMLLVPQYTYDDILGGTADSFPYYSFLETWIKKICADYPSMTNVEFVGSARPGYRGQISCFIYDTSDLTDGLPQYATGYFTPVLGTSSRAQGAIIRFGTASSNFWWDVIYPNYQNAMELTYEENEIITSAQFGNINVMRSGRVCVLNMNCAAAAVSSGTSFVTIGSFDSTYAPGTTAMTSFPSQNATYYQNCLSVTDAGLIRLYHPHTSTSRLRASLTWIF